LINLRFDQLVDMTGGTLLNTELGSRSFSGVSVDSRTIERGQLFVAISGERFDGHDFVEKAISSGAAGILSESNRVDSSVLSDDTPVVAVPNSHEAMLQLARKYADSVSAKRIGITGSNGKTSTKEFTHCLLSAVESDVYCSPGNFNNLVGIPLSLFAMPQATRVAVLELGISIPGEMSRLAEVVRPHLIAVLNVGPTHLEYLSSVEAVVNEKLDLVRQASPDVPVIVNTDDRLLVQEISKIRSEYVSYGLHNKATFMPKSIAEDRHGIPLVTIDNDQFRVPVFGKYQVYNLLAAYAITQTLGYSFEDVDTMSLKLSTSPMRGEIVTVRGVTFIVDCYNANPDSVRSGLESFAVHSGGKRRIIVLGDMLELGSDSERFHRDVGVQLAAQEFDMVVAVGPLAQDIVGSARDAGVESDKLGHYDSAKECAEAMQKLLKESDLVYLKGSRGIGLEVILNRWKDAEGNN